MNSPPPADGPRFMPDGTRVLCVDDESMIGELVAQILRSQQSCEVTTARSGADALRMLEERPFDVVLVDFVMPGMDGRALFQRIEEAFPEIICRLMFITGDTLTPSTIEFIRETGRPLLTKPFGLPELMKALKEILPQDGELARRKDSE
jgi:two-component system NtrC family sensor kinase